MITIEINKIYNDDCIVGMKKLNDNSIDLCITDPPYKTITGGDSNGKNSERPKGMLGGNRKLFSHQKINMKDWIPEVYRVLKEGSHCYIFTNTINMEETLTVSRQCGFKLHNILVWEKNNCTPSQYYMKNCEYILFLRKGKAKWINDIGGSKTVHEYITEENSPIATKFNNIIGNKLHPTEKPIDLLKFYIENSSEDGDLILDPFMGSGSLAVAAIETNRNYIGWELDTTYCGVANERIRNIT